jgi:hypothetical protein
MDDVNCSSDRQRQNRQKERYDHRDISGTVSPQAGDPAPEALAL